MGWIREGLLCLLGGLEFITVTGREDAETQVQGLIVAFISCGTLGSSLHLFVPPFLYMLHGDNNTVDP